MLGHDIGEDTAAYVELGREPHESRVQRRYQVIQDAIGDILVEVAFITERPDIELEALELYTPLVCDIVEIQHGEIRLPGFGAQAGEFGDFHVDVEIALWTRVIKSFQGLAGLTGHKGYRINQT